MEKIVKMKGVMFGLKDTRILLAIMMMLQASAAVKNQKKAQLQDIQHFLTNSANIIDSKNLLQRRLSF